MSQSNVHLHALLNFSEKVMKLSFFFSHKTMLSQSRPQWVHQGRVSGDDASRVWARGSAHLNHIYTDGQLTHFSGSCTRLHVKRFRWKGQMKLQLLLSIWHKELRCQKDDPPRCFIWYSRHFGARPFRGWSGVWGFYFSKKRRSSSQQCGVLPAMCGGSTRLWVLIRHNMFTCKPEVSESLYTERCVPRVHQASICNFSPRRKPMRPRGSQDDVPAVPNIQMSSFKSFCLIKSYRL